TSAAGLKVLPRPLCLFRTTLFMECYSFPSGHATWPAMCASLLLAQVVDTASIWVLLLFARHYVTDVGFGLAMGYCQYSLVERLTWLQSVQCEHRQSLIQTDQIRLIARNLFNT
uniref:Phosphatidic acid phosphatase type 2/haloperoxidase domain-containing protein n=1 Tax=Monopterus albus TaxID=43700 RepID=A0A3Q3J5X3_MONAL